MVTQQSLGLTHRRLRPPAGLQSRRLSVHSPIDRRKGRGADSHTGPPSQWSLTGVVPLHKRRPIAPSGGRTPVLLYHVGSPGQTGIWSLCAFCFPELAAGRAGER